MWVLRAGVVARARLTALAFVLLPDTGLLRRLFRLA